MAKTTKINLQELWVDNAYNLSTHRNYKIVGAIDMAPFTHKAKEEVLLRPKTPMPPRAERQIPPVYPTLLKALFDIANKDMRESGLNPDDYNLYPLYQTGTVPPEKCLRAGFWHFDLMRNLRLPVPNGKMAISIGYSVTNILPTIFAKSVGFGNCAPYPARKTIENERLHNELGESALKHGNVISPKVGQVVRYDSLTLHKGRPNLTDTPVDRVFANLSFSR